MSCCAGEYYGKKVVSFQGNGKETITYFHAKVMLRPLPPYETYRFRVRGRSKWLSDKATQIREE
jgi:hypothetical protein